MSKKDKDTLSFVNLAVPMFKTELDDFRDYCKTIDTDPRTVVYSFYPRCAGWGDQRNAAFQRAVHAVRR